MAEVAVDEATSFVPNIKPSLLRSFGLPALLSKYQGASDLLH
jgi:hypothetical protein